MPTSDEIKAAVKSAGQRPYQKHMRGPSRVQPQFQTESDINVVMKQFERTGMLPQGRTDPPHYGDFTGFSDYHQSMNQIMQAQAGFMELPAAVRLRFNNDPGEFIEFAQNTDNFDEMVEMGLATPDALHGFQEEDPASPTEPSSKAPQPPEKDPT